MPAETVVVMETQVQLVEVSDHALVVVMAPVVESVVVGGETPLLVEVGVPGPPGAGGSGGGNYERRSAFVGANAVDKGLAAPGSLESAPVWQIMRAILAPDGALTEVFAGGSAAFVHAWDDHADLSYP